MKDQSESFKLELIMKNGQITEIKSLEPEVVHVSDPMPSIDRFVEKDKEGFMSSLKHGSMLLMGQNSPGWVIVLTSNGYVMVWR
jgi:hypothetical protein